MLYHVSFFPVKQFYPRIPCFRCENENMDIPRISFSDISKLEALRAIPSSDRILKKMLDLEIYPTLYAYSMAEEFCTIVETPSQEAAGIRLLPCLETQEYVPGARYTGECWMLDPPDMKTITCEKYRVLDIELDQKQNTFIEDAVLEQSETVEDNLIQIFSRFQIKKSPDDPRLKKFLFPGNENKFLMNLLDVLCENCSV